MFYTRICFTDKYFVAVGMKSYKHLTVHNVLALPYFIFQQLARFKVQILIPNFCSSNATKKYVLEEKW